MKVQVDVDFSKLNSDEEKEIITVLSNFQDTIMSALNQSKPHTIAQYLLQLARKFNEFYHKHPVMTAENHSIRDARLLLVAAVRQVIKNGLFLLGIDVPEEM